MRILIAEDEALSRRLLERTLERHGYQLLSTENGREAWEVLRGNDPPRIAVLDWMMPEIDGVEVCRLVRQRADPVPLYVIMLTSRGETADVVAGLEAGADDYLIKPFDHRELLSRIRVGERTVELEMALEGKVRELQDALAHVKRLQGLLPICMYCKKIRDDSNTWHRLERYLSEHSEVMFSHSLCQDCKREHYPARSG